MTAHGLTTQGANATNAHDSVTVKELRKQWLAVRRCCTAASIEATMANGDRSIVCQKVKGCIAESDQ